MEFVGFFCWKVWKGSTKGKQTSTHSSTEKGPSQTVQATVLTIVSLCCPLTGVTVKIFFHMWVLCSELLMFIQHYFVALTFCHYNNTRFLLYLWNYSTNKQCLPWIRWKHSLYLFIYLLSNLQGVIGEKNSQKNPGIQNTLDVLH